jgi:hypothetical protein
MSGERRAGSKEQEARSEERVVGVGRFGVGRKAESTAGKACLLMLILAPTTFAQAEFSFDNLHFWVGTGANRAAVAIDWQENATDPPALVWGYRWDGTADGDDMLTAVVAADPRLFAKLGGTRGNPNAVYGIGYDANGDGKFAIDDDTVFDAEGFAFTGPADLATSTDATDYYAEGWFTGFWHYGVASANPYDGATWSDIAVGMASRELTDGSWDSWTFSPTFNFASFAGNPIPAPPPLMAGDFNQDGGVNTGDYTVWRNAFGSTSHLAADASGNGHVDAADYVVWRKALRAAEIGASSARAFTVPELISAVLFVSGLLMTEFMFGRNANLR